MYTLMVDQIFHASFFCVLRAFVTTMFEMQFTRVMHALIETEGRLQCSLTFCLTPASTLSLCQFGKYIFGSSNGVGFKSWQSDVHWNS